MENIINIINMRIKVIECKVEQHLYDSGESVENYNLKYIKQLRSEKSFLEELKEIIIKENEK